MRVTAETLRIARAIGAPLVGTNDSHYLEANHARAHEALLCIQTGSTLTDPEPLALLHPGVLREVGGGDGPGLRRDPRGLPQHPGRGRAVQSHPRVQPLPPAALRGARGTHAGELPSGTGAGGTPPALRGEPGGRPRGPPGARAGRHREDGLRRLLPGGVGLHPLRAAARHRRGPRARVVGGVAGGLLPRHHQRRSHPLRPPVRAISQPRADLHAGHGHRLRRRPARRGHPLRGRPLRARPGRAHHHLRDPGGQGGHPRRGPGAGHALRRRGPHRQARPGLPAQHHPGGRGPEVAAPGRDHPHPGRP